MTIGFELTLGKSCGPLALCLRDKLVRRAAASQSAKSTADAKNPLAGAHPGATVEVVVELAQTCIPAGELASLRVGDIITTDTLVTAPLVVNVAGVAQFRARAGAYKGRKAICIEDRLRPARRGRVSRANLS